MTTPDTDTPAETPRLDQNRQWEADVEDRQAAPAPLADELRRLSVELIRLRDLHIERGESGYPTSAAYNHADSLLRKAMAAALLVAPAPAATPAGGGEADPDRVAGDLFDRHGRTFARRVAAAVYDLTDTRAEAVLRAAPTPPAGWVPVTEKPPTAAEFVARHWPKVREVYVSPLSNGDDVIIAWQVEVMLYGGLTSAWAAPTEADAYASADGALALVRPDYGRDLAPTRITPPAPAPAAATTNDQPFPETL